MDITKLDHFWVDLEDWLKANGIAYEWGDPDKFTLTKRDVWILCAYYKTRTARRPRSTMASSSTLRTSVLVAGSASRSTIMKASIAT